MKNLDAIINEIGYDIVKDINSINDKTKKSKYKNFIDKALGVLANDGVYAYWVYCKANNKVNNDRDDNINIKNIFIDKFGEIRKVIDGREEVDEDFFQNLSEDLNKLLFFKEMLEKALIYARYHAKTISD